MKKREFLKKAGIISASVLTVPAFGTKQSGVENVKIVIGSDHAGFPLKSPIIKVLKSWGHISRMLDHSLPILSIFLTLHSFSPMR